MSEYLIFSSDKLDEVFGGNCASMFIIEGKDEKVMFQKLNDVLDDADNDTVAKKRQRHPFCLVDDWQYLDRFFLGSDDDPQTLGLSELLEPFQSYVQPAKFFQALDVPYEAVSTYQEKNGNRLSSYDLMYSGVLRSVAPDYVEMCMKISTSDMYDRQKLRQEILKSAVSRMNEESQYL